MKSRFECRKYAEQCRAMANGMNEEQRRQVLRMADIWEDMALDGEKAEDKNLVQTAEQEHQNAPER